MSKNKSYKLVRMWFSVLNIDSSCVYFKVVFLLLECSDVFSFVNFELCSILLKFLSNICTCSCAVVSRSTSIYCICVDPPHCWIIGDINLNFLTWKHFNAWIQEIISSLVASLIPGSDKNVYFMLMVKENVSDMFITVRAVYCTVSP